MGSFPRTAFVCVQRLGADGAWLAVAAVERYTRRLAGTCPQRSQLTDKRPEKGHQEAGPQRLVPEAVCHRLQPDTGHHTRCSLLRSSGKSALAKSEPDVRRLSERRSPEPWPKRVWGWRAWAPRRPLYQGRRCGGVEQAGCGLEAWKSLCLSELLQGTVDCLKALGNAFLSPPSPFLSLFYSLTLPSQFP